MIKIEQFGVKSNVDGLINLKGHSLTENVNVQFCFQSQIKPLEMEINHSKTNHIALN